MIFPRYPMSTCSSPAKNTVSVQALFAFPDPAPAASATRSSNLLFKHGFNKCLHTVKDKGILGKGQVE